MSAPDPFLSRWERLEIAYLERIADVVAPHTSWREKFRAGVVETARLVERYPQDARFLAVDALAAGEIGRRCQQRFAARLVELMETARNELPEPELIPQATSSWIVAMFFDRIYRRCTQPEGPDLPSQLPELMFLATSAYFGTAAGLEELISGA